MTKRDEFGGVIGETVEVDNRSKASEGPAHKPTIKGAHHAGAQARKRLDYFYKLTSGKIQGVPTPWAELNKILPGGGLSVGYHNLGAPSGRGKSQLVMQMAAHAAGLGIPVLNIQMEGDEDETFARLARILTAPDDLKKLDSLDWHWGELVGGKLPLSKGRQIAERALSKLDAMLLYMRYGHEAVLDEETIIGMARGIRSEFEEKLGPKDMPTWPMLLIVDYLQIMPNNSNASLREAISKTVTSLRRTAKAEGIALLTLSSTARSHYSGTGTGGKTPVFKLDPRVAVLADFEGIGKETGEIEYNTLTNTALHRMPRPEDFKYSKRTGEYHALHIPKIRRGEPQTIWFHESCGYFRFADLKEVNAAVKSESTASKPSQSEVYGGMG